MSWPLVRQWRDRLARADLTRVHTGLSPAGLQAALGAALGALDDHSLALAAKMPGTPWPRAAVVVARTVVTAPIEWVAVLLGRGTEVTLKVPQAGLGLAPLLVACAKGLPLSVSTARSAIQGMPFVVAMGSDATMRAIAARRTPDTVFQPHGHSLSVAWITGRDLPLDPLVPAAFADSWGGVAADAALHDGRGCLSPVVVLTPWPLAEAARALASAMARAEQTWPVGEVSPLEHALLRTRAAKARATGVVCAGTGFSVHGVPPELAEPVGLPRSVVVVSVPTAEQAARWLTPYRQWLSTVGTDDLSTEPLWRALGASRVCRPGRMQRPPLFRLHDGMDWVASTLQPL